MMRRTGDIRVPYGIDPRHALSVFGLNLFSSPTCFVRELVSNAIDATACKRDSDRRKVDITLSGNAIFTVRDYGTGMSAKEMRDVLPTFFKSTKARGNSSQIGIFGIGLYASLAHASAVVVRSHRDGRASATEATFQASDVVFRPLDWIGPGTEVTVHLRDDAPAVAKDPIGISSFIQDTFPFSPVDIFVNSVLVGGPSRFDRPWRRTPRLPNWSPFVRGDQAEADVPETVHVIRDDTRALGIALFLAREPLHPHQEGIRLFVNNVLVDASYRPSGNEFVSRFLAGAINAQYAELTLSRDGVVPGHSSMAEVDSRFFTVLVQGLLAWARRRPSAFRGFVQTHRPNFLAACALSDVLCEAVYTHIPIRSHKGEWVSFEAALQTGQAFYASHSSELAGLAKFHDLPGPVYLFESGAEQALLRKLRSLSHVIWRRIDEVYVPPPEGDLFFRAQQVTAALREAYASSPDTSAEHSNVRFGRVPFRQRVSDVVVVDLPDDRRVAWLVPKERPGVTEKEAEAEARMALLAWGCREATSIFENQLRREIHERGHCRRLYLNATRGLVKRFFAILGSPTSSDQRLATQVLRALIAIARNTSSRDWCIWDADFDDNRRQLRNLLDLILQPCQPGRIAEGEPDEHHT